MSFLDRDDLQVVLLGDLVQPRTRGAVTGLVEDLAESACRGQAGHPRQIDRTLGVSCPTQYTPLFSDQREQMSRPHKIRRPTVRVQNRLDRSRPLLRRYARPAGSMVNRKGEIRPQRRGVVIHHQRQVEPLAHLRQQRHTQEPSPVRDHEIDGFRSHFICCADEIPLIFPVLRVHDDDDLPPANCINRRVNGR